MDPHDAFFVMSSGRVETQTLHALLDKAENAKVWHHPRPEMIMETQAAYWGVCDKRKVFWDGRRELIEQAWAKGLIHGETDHNMTPFCDVIAEEIPLSRFIVLVRDPREYVRSGMRRGFYINGGEWDRGRLRPSDNDPELADWLSKTTFERVCWLWAKTYEHILNITGKLDSSRVMVVRFEDLVGNVDTVEQIFSFLGLSGYSKAKSLRILSKRLNRQKGGDYPHPADWSNHKHMVCWNTVGKIALRYGYAVPYSRIS